MSAKNVVEMEPLRAGDEAEFDVAPVYDACYHGHHQVLERLLEAVRANGREEGLLQSHGSATTLLHQLTRSAPDQCAADEQVDRARCLELLLNCGLQVKVNKQDQQGYTPLHFAALHEDQRMVAPLLKHGANIGIANQVGTRPVERIRPEAMKVALDLSVRLSQKPPSDKDHQETGISFNYDCLVPPAMPAAGRKKAMPAASETALLFFLSQSRQHKRLLHHPVLSSFLTVKWLKIQKLYLLAMMLYAAFVAILTAYVYLEFDVAPESGEVRPSPLVTAGGLVAMEVALWVVLVLLVLLELWQLVFSWRAYLSHRENILQVGLIVVLAVMLIGTIPVRIRLNIAVWAIIFAWLELVLLLGRHPKLSTYIMMFKTVTENFIKFTILFSPLIFAFAIAWHHLFFTDKRFSWYGLALLKTIVMSTGEMEYTSLDFTDLPYLGQIAFFGFLFLIVLVLMNLLNGLAVSDTAAIQADAELNSLIAQVKLIHYTEAALLGFGDVGGGNCCGWKTASACLDTLRDLLARCVTTQFPRCAKDRHMTVRKDADHYRLFCCESHKGFGVDKKVVEAAHALLAHGEHLLDDRMAAMERKLDALMKMVQKMNGSENV